MTFTALQAKEKADGVHSLRECYAVGSGLVGLWLAPSKSTMDSDLHLSHHSGKHRSTVSPGVTCTRVGRPQRGHVIFIFCF
jgi:hypothetical protein